LDEYLEKFFSFFQNLQFWVFGTPFVLKFEAVKISQKWPKHIENGLAIMADKRVCSQLPILNLVVLLLTLSVVGNNEDCRF